MKNNVIRYSKNLDCFELIGTQAPADKLTYTEETDILKKLRHLTDTKKETLKIYDCFNYTDKINDIYIKVLRVDLYFIDFTTFVEPSIYGVKLEFFASYMKQFLNNKIDYFRLKSLLMTMHDDNFYINVLGKNRTLLDIFNLIDYCNINKQGKHVLNLFEEIDKKYIQYI